VTTVTVGQDTGTIVMPGLDPATIVKAAPAAPTVMAGLDPTGSERHMRGGWVYIMTNRSDGALYIGVTSVLTRRVAEQKDGVGSIFTVRYGLKILVWAEHHEEIQLAIQRETSLKRWPRTWKADLITKSNPGWEDLALFGLP
jgi:putative endonuclease